MAKIEIGTTLDVQDWVDLNEYLNDSSKKPNKVVIDCLKLADNHMKLQVTMAIDPSLFSVKPLTSEMDVRSFSCSEDALNEYLQQDALRDMEYLYSTTKVVEYDGSIVGYFSIVVDTVNPDFVDEEIHKKYAYSRLPAVKLARLATDKRFMGNGIGTLMMGYVFRTALTLIQEAGCRLILVDAKETAEGFYDRFGFKNAKKKRGETILMYYDVKALVDSLGE